MLNCNMHTCLYLVKHSLPFYLMVLLKNNVADKEPKVRQEMERQVKAIIQSYMERMTQNRLVYANENNKKK